MSRRTFVAMLARRLYQASVGSFVAASLLAVGGVLVYAWDYIATGVLVLSGALAGCFGLALALGYAWATRRKARWWAPLAVGAALATASVVAVPFATTASSLTYFWAHRAEADQIASLLTEEESASGSMFGCHGLDEEACDSLRSAVQRMGAVRVSGRSEAGGSRVYIGLRGDFDAVTCAGADSSLCDWNWTIPAGGEWRLVTY